MKKVLQNIAAALVAASVSGCGTMMRPVMKEDNNVRVYPATRFDGEFIGAAVVGKPVLGMDSEGGWEPLNRVVWSSAQLVCGLVDLPISLVIDTVCLPYDLWTRKDNIANPTSEGIRRPADGSPKPSM
jgi:uncharacterized protein YceK